MSRKKEFALVDDSSGDLNRKLKAIRYVNCEIILVSAIFLRF